MPLSVKVQNLAGGKDFTEASRVLSAKEQAYGCAASQFKGGFHGLFLPS